MNPALATANVARIVTSLKKKINLNYRRKVIQMYDVVLSMYLECHYCKGLIDVHSLNDTKFKMLHIFIYEK